MSKEGVIDQDVDRVDARILHNRLSIKTKFNDWAKRRIKDLCLVSGCDYWFAFNSVGDYSGFWLSKEVADFFYVFENSHVCQRKLLLAKWRGGVAFKYPARRIVKNPFNPSYRARVSVYLIEHGGLAVYVGQTTKSLKERLSGHFSKSKAGDEELWVYSHMRANDFSGYTIRELEQTLFDRRLERENFYIEKFGLVATQSLNVP